MFIKCRRPLLVLLLSSSSSSFPVSTVNTIEQSFLDATHILQLVELPPQPLKIVEEEIQKQLSNALVQLPPNSAHHPAPFIPPQSASLSHPPSLSRSNEHRKNNAQQVKGMEFLPLDDIQQLAGAEYCGQAFHSFLLFSKNHILFILDQVCIDQPPFSISPHLGFTDFLMSVACCT